MADAINASAIRMRDSLKESAANWLSDKITMKMKEVALEEWASQKQVAANMWAFAQEKALAAKRFLLNLKEKASAMATAAANFFKAHSGIPFAGVGIALGAIAAMMIAMKAFGGKREKGGTVMGNTPYLVGEKGPELFQPGRTGRIVQNDLLGGNSGGVINNNIAIHSDGNIFSDPIALRKVAEMLNDELERVAETYYSPETV